MEGREHAAHVASRILESLDVAFPLGVFTTVTGVSGSGKSTLVSQLLVELVSTRLGNARPKSDDTDGDALEGLEKSYDDCLTATNGKRAYQKGKDGVIIPGTKVQQDAVDGGTLELTIHRDLQWYLQQLIGEQVQDMRAERGAILVVETATGKIRAAAEYPTADPNQPGAVEGVRGSKIFESTFEPGSGSGSVESQRTSRVARS